MIETKLRRTLELSLAYDATMGESEYLVLGNRAKLVLQDSKEKV